MVINQRSVNRLPWPRFADVKLGIDAGKHSRILQAECDNLMNIQLVSHDWSGCGLEHIFHTIVLYPHPTSWINLNKIAETPALATWVRHIKAIRLGNLPEHNHIVEWRERHSEAQSDLRFCAWFQDPAMGRSLQHQYNSYQTKEEISYGNYRYWQSGESAMELRRSHGGRYTLKLDLFLQLESIETVREVSIVHVSSEPYGRWTRREIECMVDNNRCHPPMNTHLELFMTARMHCGANLTSLKLHNPCELLGSAHTRQMNLDCLETLILDFSGPWHTSEGWPLDFDYILAPWLYTLTALRNFSLTQRIPEHQPAPNILGVLSELFFPEVRSIHLQNVVTNPEALHLFLSRNCRKLSSLVIREPVMQPDEWEYVRWEIHGALWGKMMRGTRVTIGPAYKHLAWPEDPMYSELQLVPFGYWDLSYYDPDEEQDEEQDEDLDEELDEELEAEQVRYLDEGEIYQ